ncbi:sucrase ferredoxin [Leifsonia sp. NPDC058230]|uniref:sucrase ferredoxin n=1 Tax=Leifsonia sp. NPDC058230 TaxID=3346391 RepID=UPI0036D7AA4F
MAEPGWEPCSNRSLERNDPLPGTAGLGERWLLVEIESAWGEHAFFSSALEVRIAAQLVSRAEAAGIRPLAIRRTRLRAEERRSQSSWRWALVDCRPARESIRWGEVRRVEDLLTVALDGSAGEPSDRAVYCVCTHARHDQCCAVRGRPVVEELARQHPEETWECSHLGGDRFAATMILFPHGLLYGRVPAADVGRVVEKYDAGLVDSPYLRGRTALSTIAQAAEAFARDASRDERVDAYGVVSEHAHPHGWTVELDHDGRRVTVEVGERLSEPLLSTCGATIPRRVREFVPISIATA